MFCRNYLQFNRQFCSVLPFCSALPIRYTQSQQFSAENDFMYSTFMLKDPASYVYTKARLAGSAHCGRDLKCRFMKKINNVMTDEK